jgi:hypothetical protein
VPGSGTSEKVSWTTERRAEPVVPPVTLMSFETSTDPVGLNIAAIQFEIRRHDWETFAEDGIIVPGCSTYRKKLYTIGQFMDHLADSIPALINRLSGTSR